MSKNVTSPVYKAKFNLFFSFFIPVLFFAIKGIARVVAMPFNFNDDPPPVDPPPPFDPSKVDKTYKVNNEDIPFADVFAKAKEKYGFDETKMTNEKIMTVVDDYIFVANKQVANELFNQKTTEYNTKFAQLENDKIEVARKMNVVEDLIKKIETDGAAKLLDIDTKLKDSDLSVQDQIKLGIEKETVLRDIENAKAKQKTNEFYRDQELNKVTIQKERLITDQQLENIYINFPDAKPSEDFGTLYQKITNPATAHLVKDEDKQKFLVLYDAVSQFRNTNIPAVDTFKLKYGNQFKGNGNSNNGKSEIELTLQSLIDKGIINTDLNTVLEQLKNPIPPITPGSATNRGKGFVPKTRDDKLAEANF